MSGPGLVSFREFILYLKPIAPSDPKPVPTQRSGNHTSALRTNRSLLWNQSKSYESCGQNPENRKYCGRGPVSKTLNTAPRLHPPTPTNLPSIWLVKLTWKVQEDLYFCYFETGSGETWSQICQTRPYCSKHPHHPLLLAPLETLLFIVVLCVFKRLLLFQSKDLELRKLIWYWCSRWRGRVEFKNYLEGRFWILTWFIKH